MRKELSNSEGERRRFRAVFSRFGSKVNYKGHSEPTLLLTKVAEADTGKLVTDHVWFAYTQGFQACTLTAGVVVEFEARVKAYTKGYVNRRIGIDQKTTDYKLSHPTKITVL
ncbi:hypothetical protein V9K67_24970 [Paraflavisolibacter sp. H34]|uniref:hypothetical protein n=1 Tax=Huijunlia imazamoxiresistens TaxID=3127457 RepID=UPI00301A8232